MDKIRKKKYIIFWKITAEFPITLESAQGRVATSLVNEESIRDMIKRIKNNSDKKKLAFIRIDSIQILLPSTYLDGIDSPVKILIIDERIKDTKDKVIGGVTGILKYTTLKFDVNLQYAIPLQLNYLNNSIGILYKIERENLMEKDDIPFSTTYAVSYALGNSHHSVTYREKDQIEIEELFSEIGTEVKMISGIGLAPNIGLKREPKLIEREEKIVDFKEKPFQNHISDIEIKETDKIKIQLESLEKEVSNIRKLI
ncbi:hypothetical protein VNO78_06945 [Psophocarpus tetragonolobus]|uniref:Uncharacterized protein n=1 Tax=Psophocarpus tetragonolobus TaxID=3891 RepID=A0AAN9T2B4_PSOTE